MKFAICQELFEGWDWEKQCEYSASIGYTGLEVAPFALAETLSDISSDQRKELKSTAEKHGLEIIGLHWLLAKTEGLHLTTADDAVRAATSDYLIQLGDLCGDLGGTVMVFGSPFQRNLEEGTSYEQAFDRAVDVFKKAMPRIADRGVSLLMEPLTTKETNFVNTCDQAAEMIAAVDNPYFALHQDVKAMLGEGTPLPGIIEKHKDITRHFHVNDTNLLGPGMGETDYHPIFQALLDSGYDGWVSVEVFDYSPGAEKICEESMAYMKQVLADLEKSNS
ncbi:sugar phosphate isomerase/epimerase family protein [Thalassoglobus polymorphus]|uniref:D-tagatose 3-epimerase n=1 Tax=Thalassoglobus polymorphus TaxID=2527994 RepID=A0A517QT76_9PLAN|nr:sugar phosphate isomerase/epimerase family protein [Thalassoglobus polymorphus]QDT34843.1 D-tagatose 3-epimerase [Thalassoglobus polymorphus]